MNKAVKDNIYSKEAEKALLACILLQENIENQFELINLIDDKMFYNEEHGTIFKSIKSLIHNGFYVDLVFISQELYKTNEKLVSLVAELFTIIPNAKNFNNYHRQVSDCYQNREINRLIHDTKMLPAGDRVTEIMSGLNKVQSIVVNNIQPISEIIDYVDDAPASKRFKTGIKAIDEHFLGGISQGLWVVAARTHVGKSDFAIQMGLGLANNGVRVRLDNFENSQRLYIEKMIAKTAGLFYEDVKKVLDNKSFKKYNKGMFWELSNTPHKFAKNSILASEYGEEYTLEQKVALASDYIKNLKISILSKPYKFSELELWLRVNRSSIDVLIIDQLMNLIDNTGFQQQRLKYTQLMVELSNLSKKYDLPIVLLHQLNREVAKDKDNRRPRIDDFMEADSIGQLADVVLLLHRPNYKKEYDTSKTMDIIRKHPHLTTETVKDFYYRTEMIVEKDRILEKAGEIYTFSYKNSNLIDMGGLGGIYR